MLWYTGNSSKRGWQECKQVQATLDTAGQYLLALKKRNPYKPEASVLL